ncbi:hypothetical protein [Paenibacillus sp. UASWS1643]|nr:hypothetical protein [Paenibacillus sp. UASWS1643]
MQVLEWVLLLTATVNMTTAIVNLRSTAKSKKNGTRNKRKRRKR